MKRNFFVLSTIALFTIVGLLIFEHATSAQRPDRNAQPEQGERGQRQGGERGNRSMGMMGNPISLVDNSWLDLTFNVKVDDETLVKARPVYQATREKFQKKMTEIRESIRESGDFRNIREQMTTLTATTSTEFQKSLKEVLSKEDMAKLTELTKKRLLAQQEARNRFRGGGEGSQRGGGDQRGQRGTR